LIKHAKDRNPNGEERDPEDIARLNAYILSHAQRISPQEADFGERLRTRTKLLPLLVIGATVVFPIALLLSFVSGLVERKFSMSLWDKLGFPSHPDSEI